MVDNKEKVDRPEDADPLQELYTVTEAEEPTPNSEAREPKDDLPEKYQGKSIADIARMHQELEQRFGQQGNEVGQLRKTLDEYILRTLDKDKEPAKEEEEVDYFSDPDKAVSKAIQKSPEVKRALEAAESVKQMTLQQELMRRHPDTNSILQDSGFQDWVGKSRLRQRMLVEADRNYDLEAADELFTEWKSLKRNNTDETVRAEATARKQEVKRASTGAARGSSRQGSKKLLKRVDIIELHKTNPAKYEAMLPEIRKAYEEGRVI